MSEMDAPVNDNNATVLVIACGALASEVLALKSLNGWDHIQLTCLPAKLHNTPAKIPDALRRKIRAERSTFDHIFVAYGDCGTAGGIDKVIEEEGCERIGGAHCYAFYMGLEAFDSMHMDNPGSYYLTDFLVKHFDTLVYKGMGLDRFPELRDMYFGNYNRLVYLAQTDDPELTRQAEKAAQRLGLDFHRHSAGYGDLETALAAL